MTEKAKITGLQVSNFKRVKLIEIRPEQNGLTIIGGKNRQGKSSVLDAIAYALGGETFRPSTVNNSESDENAVIRVEIDGMIVERKGKNADLKVTDARGLKGGQTLLNEIVSKFALDLGAFINASETDKAKMLLKMFPELESSLAEMNQESEALKEERADLNRDIKRMQAQYDGMTEFPDAPQDEIKIEELTEKLADASNADKELRTAENELNNIERELTAKADQIAFNGETGKAAVNALAEFESQIEVRRAELKKAIEDKRAQYGKLLADKQELEVRKEEKNREIETRKQNVSKNDMEAIQSEIVKIGETNAKVRQNQTRSKLHREIEELKKSSEARTAAMDEIKIQRSKKLTSANLPLPELTIDEESKLLYRGQKWDCMSGAEKLKVATAICMGTKPGCGFVLIDGLEAMDSDTLTEFSEYLAGKGMQGIGTIVGKEQATVIIEDGRIEEKDETGDAR